MLNVNTGLERTPSTKVDLTPGISYDCRKALAEETGLVVRLTLIWNLGLWFSVFTVNSGWIWIDRCTQTAYAIWFVPVTKILGS